MHRCRPRVGHGPRKRRLDLRVVVGGLELETNRKCACGFWSFGSRTPFRRQQSAITESSALALHGGPNSMNDVTVALSHTFSTCDDCNCGFPGLYRVLICHICCQLLPAASCAPHRRPQAWDWPFLPNQSLGSRIPSMCLRLGCAAASPPCMSALGCNRSQSRVGHGSGECSTVNLPAVR